MTTLTKTECEAILERLTDKTLSFGCVCEIQYPPYEQRTITRFAYKTPRAYYFESKWRVSNPSNDRSNKLIAVLGHPVTLLDVLERMEKAAEEIGPRKALQLLDLWQPFGFKAPLQSILNLIEWEWTECSTCDSKGVRTDSNPFTNGGYNFPSQVECESCGGESIILIAKPSPATNLFLFLKQINL